jgi:hypothetical protein
LQIKGVAELVSDQPDADGWLRFKITPDEVWCFDSRAFRRHRQPVSLFGAPRGGLTPLVIR